MEEGFYSRISDLAPSPPSIVRPTASAGAFFHPFHRERLRHACLPSLIHCSAVPRLL